MGFHNVSTFVFSNLMGFEQYEKQKPFVFNNLMGSFGRIRISALVPSARPPAQ
jgi:hypothetical protein